MDRAARPTASSGYRAGASSNAAALCCSRPWLPGRGGTAASSSSAGLLLRRPRFLLVLFFFPFLLLQCPLLSRLLRRRRLRRVLQCRSPAPASIPSLPMHGSRWRQCNRELRHSRSEKRVCVLKRTELTAKYQGRRGVWPGKDVWLGRTGSKGSIDVQYS